MKFQFHYEPTKLKMYVRENFSKVDFLPYPNYDSDLFKGDLARLRGQVDIKIHEDIKSFNEWLLHLNRKYQLLLPFIYEELLTGAQQKSVVQAITVILEKDKRVFANLLHQCYSKNNFEPYWSLLVYGYKKNPTFYNKYWNLDVKKIWAEYSRIKRKHAKHVGEQALNRIQNIDAVMDLHFIREEHLFHREVLIYIFEHGTIELFQREESRFKKLLKTADNVTAQKLATGFVRANAMYKMEEIAYMIFNQLNTYIKYPMFWANTEKDVKERFHQWYLRENIKEFFNGIHKEHERFLYWEKFIPRMKDALVLSDRQTILFYFPEVVIMEILDTGAVYVYETDVFENLFGRKVNAYRENLDKHGDVAILKRSMIMNKNYVYQDGWLTHSGAWQYKFDRYLERALNWEV